MTFNMTVNELPRAKRLNKKRIFCRALKKTQAVCGIIKHPLSNAIVFLSNVLFEPTAFLKKYSLSTNFLDSPKVLKKS